MHPGNSFCAACGNALIPGARFCSRCGATAFPPPSAVTVTFPPAVLPQAPGNQIPEELLAKWSWGPFWATPLWAFWNADTMHKVIGVVLTVFAWLSGGIFAFGLLGYGIYMGVRGNRIAAANRRFSSLNEFLAVQHAWALWGFIAFLVEVAVVGVFFFFLLFFGVLAALVSH